MTDGLSSSVASNAAARVHTRREMSVLSVPEIDASRAVVKSTTFSPHLLAENVPPYLRNAMSSGWITCLSVSGGTTVSYSVRIAWMGPALSRERTAGRRQIGCSM